jgi:hypothetical protein
MSDSLEQRVELLRHGIVVVGDEAGTVELTGAGSDRVHEVAARVLGEAFEVIGETPRLIEPRVCRGHMEREPGRLQVRFALTGDEHVDDIIVAEDEQTVVVFCTVCTATAGEEGERWEGPWHVYLDAPLGRRTVIDGSTGEPVPYRNIWAEIEREERVSRRSRRARPRGAPSPRARRPR